MISIDTNDVSIDKELETLPDTTDLALAHGAWL
jgi:hypothetical protein